VGRAPAARRNAHQRPPVHGLRPGEALGLRWADVRENNLLVQRAISLGDEADTKTRAHRTVRLLAPLARDLRE
jgi:integrase